MTATAFFGYAPASFLKDQLWRVADKLFKEEVKGVTDDCQIGSLLHLRHPEEIACYAGIEVDKCSRGEEASYEKTKQFSQIISETSESMTVSDSNTLSVLYHSLLKIPNLMDFKLNRKTKVADLSKYVAEKAKWVAQELANVSDLPVSRRKDLVTFCVALSREASCPRQFFIDS